jgi:hypothetical protein
LQQFPYAFPFSVEPTCRNSHGKSSAWPEVSRLSGGKSVKDVNVVLRNKRVLFAELALEIDGLEAAATALRSVIHLLHEQEEDPAAGSPVRLSISEDSPEGTTNTTAVVPPERSRVRRWV